ncbi:MAG: hypothetical protein ISR87_12095 [Candidatus Marinimicrobia bacterium]|nr:hypothetical protein [FCB group bacterium]MBL7026188.1 hypothetical protein [Candidatus Neomarinimicrobiota bacterium]
MNKILSTLATVTIGILALLIPYTCAVAQTPEWIVYKSSNSGLPSDGILSLAIDDTGCEWIRLEYGLFSFNGTDWIEYDCDTSFPPGGFKPKLKRENGGMNAQGSPRGIKGQIQGDDPGTGIFVTSCIYPANRWDWGLS